MRWSRTVLSTTLSVALIGCAGEDAAPAPQGEAGTAPVTPRPTDVDADAARAACAYGPGALAAETLGATHRVGADIPLEHVIIVMMENRSFDHLLSELPALGQPDVDVAPRDATNPDGTGASVARFHDDRYCTEDPDHGWAAEHRAASEGKLDGFVVASPGAAGTHAMGYLDATDVPFHLALANTFATGDRYFQSLLGPTWPNRMYLYSASSHGLTKNTLPSVDMPNLIRSLTEANVDFGLFPSEAATAMMFFSDMLAATKGCRDGVPPCHKGSFEDGLEALRTGNLPAVSFIEPSYGVSRTTPGYLQTSGHPPGNIQLADDFLFQVVDALTHGPAWKSSALFITYDENGGFYDHVVPPAACAPGDLPPPEADSALGGFDQLGFRVPVFVVSPYAKRHHVSHRVYDHSSILRFVESRFGLRAFTRRDANAEPMSDFFDWEHPDFSIPQFTRPTVDHDRMTRCEQEFSGD